MRTQPLSGEQIHLSGFGYTADIASVGASLRSLTYQDRDLVMPFGADEVRPRYRGATLAPWPNRVIDGTYLYEGVAHQLDLTEPARGHALHGLALWLNFDVIVLAEHSVTLRAVIEPQAGYPHRILLIVRYWLSAKGLGNRVTATNLSAGTAPYGVGPHPYLVAGEGRVDEWTLTTSASAYLEAEGTRLLPGDVVDITPGDDFDFTSGKTVGSLFIDHAFTQLDFTNGNARVELRAPGGTGVAMTWGSELPWLQLHTADMPDVDISRRGLAVEPMTCPPDAFNSGTDLIHLEPNQQHAAAWFISALD